MVDTHVLVNGASHGKGLAVAWQLGRQGATVILNARNMTQDGAAQDLAGQGRAVHFQPHKVPDDGARPAGRRN